MSLVSGFEQKFFRLYFSCTKGSPVATILLLKTSQKCFFMLPFASNFKIFINVSTFLYVRQILKKLVKKYCFLLFSEKC